MFLDVEQGIYGTVREFSALKFFRKKNRILGPPLPARDDYFAAGFFLSPRIIFPPREKFSPK